MAPVFNLKDSIVEALNALGGTATATEVRAYIKSKYGRDWKDIEKVMDDLCRESASSFFLPEDRVLTKIGQGKYSIGETAVPEPSEENVESSKPLSDFGLERKVFSFRDAEELLQKKGQLSTIMQAASLTDLSSIENHDKIQHFLHKNKFTASLWRAATCSRSCP